MAIGTVFAQRGFFLEPADPEHPWDAPAGWNTSDPLWVSAESSPIEDDLVADGLAGDHLPNGGLGLRHGSVRVMEDGETLEVFYSRKWEEPEYIMRSTVDLSAGDWQAWQTSYPPEDMVRAEEDWGGRCGTRFVCVERRWSVVFVLYLLGRGCDCGGKAAL